MLWCGVMTMLAWDDAVRNDGAMILEPSSQGNSTRIVYVATHSNRRREIKWTRDRMLFSDYYSSAYAHIWPRFRIDTLGPVASTVISAASLLYGDVHLWGTPLRQNILHSVNLATVPHIQDRHLCLSILLASCSSAATLTLSLSHAANSPLPSQ